MTALIISFAAAPLVYGLHRWFEGNRQRQRKLNRLQQKIQEKEREQSNRDL